MCGVTIFGLMWDVEQQGQNAGLPHAMHVVILTAFKAEASHS